MYVRVCYIYSTEQLFLENPNFSPGGNPEKIVRWFESIAHAYPNDASMCAALAKGYRLMGQAAKSEENRRKFIQLVEQFSYWQRRIREFPELLDLAEVPHRLISKQGVV